MRCITYVALTATFLYCPSGVFNNLQSPNSIPGLDDKEDAMKCDCHPTCTEVSYTTEISESNFFKSEYDVTNFL
jgi:Amiloride-sensitive sodium channel.